MQKYNGCICPFETMNILTQLKKKIKNHKMENNTPVCKIKVTIKSLVKVNTIILGKKKISKVT